jgi:3-hydroxyacyl-CoA dehydrogenase
MKTVAIIGSGVMGSGIALCSAQSGYETTVYDINTDALNKAKSYITQLIDTSISKGKSTEEEKTNTLAKLKFTNNFEDLKADLILEAILEKLPVKQIETRNKRDMCHSSSSSSKSNNNDDDDDDDNSSNKITRNHLKS